MLNFGKRVVMDVPSAPEATAEFSTTLWGGLWLASFASFGRQPDVTSTVADEAGKAGHAMPSCFKDRVLQKHGVPLATKAAA